MVSVPTRRSQVAFASANGISQRRACTLFKVGRSALRYRSLKTDRDAPVLAAMRTLSGQYPRYGYRRIRIFLGRDGHKMSAGRAHRLWTAARLQVPRKRPRKRIASGRPRPLAPTGRDQVWSYDFVFDWAGNGQQLKCLTVTASSTHAAAGAKPSERSAKSWWLTMSSIRTPARSRQGRPTVRGPSNQPQKETQEAERPPRGGLSASPAIGPHWLPFARARWPPFAPALTITVAPGIHIN